ncbi:MAG TPA: carboxypeptidase-like regulatory domain-containing protein, partial [Opitutus sp.]|nr:carboxypeptidase-like regulatory domain-containing protein [Opitutus sp.]
MKQAILVLLTACLCQAGALRVLVRDPSGAAIANATVRAGADAFLTDAAGEARFPSLPAGRVTVAIEAEGFAPYTTRVQVREPLTTFERKLSLAPRSDKVEVGVDPREDATDPRGNFGATALTPQQIEQLPDDPDELERVLQEMAGPGAVMRVNGFRGGRLPHKSQIASIRFRLTPYSAEEHDDGFMHVDIQTKPGMGEWHGDLAVAFGDDSLNARNAFAPRREPQQMRRLDVNLMGPVIKNRTSTSFNFSRNDGYDARTSNGFLPDGPFSQLIRLPNEALSGGARLQHALTRSQILRGEYQFERSDRASAANFDLPERVSTTFSNLHQLRLSALGSISEKTVNELRFQGQWTDNGTSSLTSSPAVIVQGAFHAGGANADSNRVTRAFELTDHVSFNKGKHSFRAGVQIDHLRHRG